ncbi:MAG: L,D-transpeptidase [Puniceicoccales bacterium]|jgi:hypothetical protein|nr:L,D-transpeptidase [Puniceicoccales bacterium]
MANEKQMWEELLWAADQQNYRLSSATHFLHVSIARQKMFFCRGEKILFTYDISTSTCPPCNEENSNGTPLGLHRICEKYGNDAAEGTVFIGRVSSGKHYKCYTNWKSCGRVLTRILRLEGLMEGVNRGKNLYGNICDSYLRYIYIHGTAFEEHVGTPTSHGCITMRNKEIITLYERVEIDTFVNLCMH